MKVASTATKLTIDMVTTKSETPSSIAGNPMQIPSARKTITDAATPAELTGAKP